MADEVHIRHIRDSDWDNIVALEAGTYSDSALSEEPAALESRSRSSPTTCFVLETGQQIAGYVLALPYPMFTYPDLARTEAHTFRSPNLHLHDLVIAERFRRDGLAKKLLRHLMATARSQRYERISLVAVAGSDTYWSAHGYHPHPEVALPESYGANAIYMSRTI